MLAVALLAAVVAGILTAVVGAGGGGRARSAQRSAPPSERVVRFAIHSTAVHRTLHEILVVPGDARTRAAGRGRGLLVVLPAAGANPGVDLSPQLRSAIAALGTRAPDIVLVDGSASSYWHNRGGGRWASYLIHEVIPQAMRRAGTADKVSIDGPAMGGFGALDVARLAPGRFCSVRADSPSVVSSAGSAPQGAFDDGADFARHDLLAIAAGGDPWGRTPLSIDVGARDPLRSAAVRLVDEMRAHGARVALRVASGGHDETYWRGTWRRGLAWDARELSRCHARTTD